MKNRYHLYNIFFIKIISSNESLIEYKDIQGNKKAFGIKPACRKSSVRMQMRTRTKTRCGLEETRICRNLHATHTGAIARPRKFIR